MSVQLPRSTMDKLTHESPEIRLRTLDQIESKLMRAIAHNESIVDFRPGDLCKQLIRWFGCQPLQSPAKVLTLLSSILRSQYGSAAIERLGAQRFQREIGKVQLLMRKRTTELPLVEEIQQLLQQYVAEAATARSSGDDDVVEMIATLDLNNAAQQDQASEDGHHYQQQHRGFQYTEADCEVPWSKPSVVDFNSMRFLADILVNPLASAVELQNALQHLQITMCDYPAEYLLQAPNVFGNLLAVFERAEELAVPLADITNTLLAFLKCLQQRLTTRRQCLAFACKQNKSQVPSRTQLKVSRALELLLTKCAQQLQNQNRDLRAETTHTVRVFRAALEIYRLQELCVPHAILQRLASIAEKLRNACEQQEHFTLQRIEFLHVTFLLQNMAENNALRAPLHDADALTPLLADFTLQACFPRRYAALKALLCAADYTLNEKFELLHKLEQSFASALELLLKPQQEQQLKSAVALIARGADICATLEKLRSLRLLELLFNAITACNSLYVTQPELRAQACELLLQLLRLSHAPLKAFVYQQLAQTLKKHFACLMNAESFVVGVPNAHLLSAQIIGVPLSSELLLHVTQESATAASNAHADIKRNCDDILALLLKSKHLLSDTHWPRFVELLLPVLPLLQCYCVHAPPLLPLLMQLFDPDAFNLPFLAVLQGNIRFLFYGNDATVRSEALTRLIFMLHAMPNAAAYVPNIMEISDLIPNDLLLLPAPRDCSRIFCASEAFADASTLRNLIALLETRDIEPLIRKTTLMQLNVMCQSWSMTGTLCADAAYFFALQALENSMQRDAYADYSDAAIPAVGLLAKALLYDSEMRQELANTPNIYILLLRALFLYQNDIQVRQDACICLFQLLFVGFLVVPGGSRVEVPRICDNLQLPLKCEFVDFNSDSEAVENQLTIFADAAAESRYLRHFIATNCCGGSLAQVTRQHLCAQQSLDIASELQLTAHDLRLCRATQPTHNLRRFLRAAQNATDAQTLINACITLKLQLLLVAQLKATSNTADDDASACSIPADFSAELYAQFCKYLQMPPGNDSDLALYEQLLELFDLCLLLPLPTVAASLAQTLQSDFQHALISLLKNSGIPLRFYHKLSQFLAHLLSAPASFKAVGTHATISIFYSNLFDLAADVATQLFAQRDLQRVRCLLALLQQLASLPLDMPDKLLLYYCKRFLTLSLSLKSFTQTGAQWQRDCLLLICRLAAQMQLPCATFKLSPSCVKYVSGLCGHNDAQVRALAWCVLAHVARFRPPNGVNEPTGAQLLVSELAYLPGGCLACCLSTLLDCAEVVLVRQLAGQLFVELLAAAEVATFDEAATLLAQHAFFRQANDALSCCRLTAQLPIHFVITAADAACLETETYFSTCELISCYTRISIKMAELEPNFLAEFVARPFPFKLYELLKPPPEHSNPAYFPMCADICQLYAMFYPKHFVFLQRTLCRDQVWLASFCALLSQSDVAADEALVSVLQLLLVLAKDDSAYAEICVQLAKAPAVTAANLLKLFTRALTIANLNTPLQRCTLAVLCLLLIKSQAATHNSDAPLKSFVDILETPMEVGIFAAANAGDTALDATTARNKENSPNAGNKSSLSAANSKRVKAHSTNSKCTKAFDNAGKSSTGASSSLAEYIFIELLRIFTHLNHTKSCKFESTPSASKIQITESLAVLLKLSPHALAAASNLKLFDKLLRILNTFLEEFNTSCSTFVRRYGEAKKLVIVRNLQLHFQLLLHWFSAPTALLTDERQAFELTKVLIQLWPWLVHSAALKLLVLQLCAHLSERSLLVCTQFSTLVASYAHSVLQLVLKIVQFETTKVKAASSEQFPVIAVGLRLVMNCCACAEGRLALVKSHTLDIFDGLHPFNPKSPKIKLEILESWLEFWELFSRYAEGALARNLNSLCAVVNRTAVPCAATRLLSLRILRNMCFLPANRTPLMNSTDFMYTVSEVLAQPMDTEAHVSYEEQLLVSVAIWKLISGGVKFVAQIRGTKLAKQLRMLRESLTALGEEEEGMAETTPNAGRLQQLPFARDLANVLDVILGIFQQQ